MSASKEQGPDLPSIIRAAVFSCDESIVLVSREGTKFPVTEELARQSSPYFDALLDNGMIEAGTRVVALDDMSADAIRAIITSMTVSKGHWKSTRGKPIFKSLDAANVIEVLEFSSRLLMPWAGIHYAGEAIRGSTDAKSLIQLALHEAEFDDQADRLAWGEVLDLIPQRLALVVEEAAAMPAFGQIGINILSNIVRQIEADAWTSEESVAIGENEKALWLCHENPHGLALLVDMVDAEKVIVARVKLCSDCTERTWSLIQVFDFKINAKASHGEDLSMFGIAKPFVMDGMWGWSVIVSLDTYST